MLTADIYAAAARMKMAPGTLLALAREAAQDARLISVGHMRRDDQEQLLQLLGWITIQDAEMLRRTSRFQPMPIAA